jgi:uncharacterized protein YjbJ (UPF0337 family)
MDAVQQFKGDLKEQWGRCIDDEVQQAEGGYDKIIGMLQERYGTHCGSLVRERYGGKKDELIRWAGPWQQGAAPEAVVEQSHSRDASHEKRLTTCIHTSD